METDNFGGDYPNEQFVSLPSLSKEHAQKVADAINAGFPDGHRRFWVVVQDDYQLQPGFEP